MILDSLINYIYHQPISDLIRLSIVAALASVTIYRKYGQQCWWKPMTAAALCIWAAAVLISTVLSRTPGGTYSLSPIPFHSYLEVLDGGNPELLRSNFMNALLFLPAGILGSFLLPTNCASWKKLAVMIAVSFCFSLSIESMQYFLAVGHFEADDILHNTLGVVGGYALCGWALNNVPPAD